jgi:protein-disulfide isomerase
MQVLGTGALIGVGLALVSCNEKPKAAEAGSFPGKITEKPGDIALGDPKAPVQIVEYASMTCSHCAAFAIGDPEHKKEAVFPQIKAKYIDTGKVRYILREFPLDAFATAAFMAMRCAVGTDPSRYYAAVDLVFSRQKQWAFSTQDPNQIKSNLADVLKETGLGRAQFDSCVADETGLKRVQAVQNDAVDSYKVESTPTFIINGTKFPGELEFKRFEELVAPLLKAS